MAENKTKQRLEENKSLAEKVVKEIDDNLRRNAGNLSNEAIVNMKPADFKIWRESLHELARWFMTDEAIGKFISDSIREAITPKDPPK